MPSNEKRGPNGVGRLRALFGAQRQKPRGRAQFNLRGRLAIVAGTLALCSVALLGRAFDLQVVHNKFYQAQGDARFLREIPIATSRGMITDRNGEPLAVSTPVESIWANPQLLLKSPERIPELAKALGVPSDHLARKLSQRASKEFVYLQRRMRPEAAQAIVKLGIPGVFSQREYRRFYPQGEAVAHVLGFTNIDDSGQEGLELAFDEWLRGTPGAEKVIRDRRGRIVENVDLVRAALPGKDLTLSIDRRIQFLAYRELRNALLEKGASSGSAVVLDVATGEVLAMANLPSYNPNAVESANRDAHRNRAVTDLIEPGSTMKPITVAAALENHAITLGTRFDTNPGWIAERPLPHDRHAQLRRARHHGRDHQELQRRRRDDRAPLAGSHLLRLHAQARLWPHDRERIPGRSGGPAAGAGSLERHEQADDVLRLRPERDAAADRAGVRCDRQRRQVDRADVRERPAQRGPTR